MEETKHKNSNKQNRKKTQVVKGGGGGIGVVLLWGGVFAVAAFVVTSINKGNKKRLNFPTDDKKKSNRTNCNAGAEEEERNEGLRSLLQTRTPIGDPHLCCTGSSIGNNVIKMGSPQEDELKTVVACGDLKIVANLDGVINDEILTADIERDSLPEIEMYKSGQDKSNKEDCFEDSISVEAVKEVVGVVELPATAPKAIIHQDKNPKMLLKDSTEDDEEDDDEVDYEDEELEEEDEDDIYDDGSVEGKGDEDSEGTGESSRESNAEAIWPVELIEEYQHLELKKGNDQILEENIHEGGTKTLEVSSEVAWKGNADILQQDHRGRKETGCMMMGNCASLIIISKSRLRMWSSLAVGLLILAILHHLLVSSFLNLNIQL